MLGLKKQNIVHWLDRYIRLNESLIKYCDLWLAGFSFIKQDLNGANFKHRNIRGCDFSRCQLEEASFESIVGGISWVRPVGVLTCLGLAVLLTKNSVPSIQMAFEELGLDMTGGTTAFACLATTFVLWRLLSVLLVSKPVSKGIIEQNLPNHNVLTRVVTLPLVFLSLASVCLIYACLIFMIGYAPVLSANQLAASSLLIFLTGLPTAWLLKRQFGEVFQYRTSFASANLKRSSFRDAVLPHCNFSKADLRNADLQGGNFVESCFRGADLSHANLSGANLVGVDLRKAKTTGAIGLMEAQNANNFSKGYKWKGQNP